MKAEAVPTIFNVFLIEIDDDYSETFCNISTVPNVSACCKKLREENEQLKCKLQSDQIKMNFRTKRMNKIRQQKAREIQSLKKQIANLEKKVDRNQKKIDEQYYVDLKVFFFLILIFDSYLYIG